MSENYTITRDLKEAAAMAEALEDYLQQKALYGSVGSGGLFSSGDMPSMTVGALLMRMRRLHALRDQLTPEQWGQLRDIEQTHHDTATEWRLHYDQKIVREAHSRLDAMLPFFEEHRKNPDFGAQVYKPEALRRTIVQELAVAISDRRLEDDAFQDKMKAVDNQLRGCVQQSDFLWAEMLQPAYPPETFWWLYSRPVRNQ